jgi:1-acylglycerone phosphate reductase
MLIPLTITGLRVFAAARSLTKMAALADKGIELIELDVTKSDSILNAKNTITEQTGGKLDYLVNNA